MSQFDQLTRKLEGWLDEPAQKNLQGVRGCAFEMLHEDECTAEQRNWLGAFVGEWETAEDEALEWATSHQARALAEGWGVFDSDERGLEIQRYDMAGTFASDAAAIVYVKAAALMGDGLAQRALHVVEHWQEFQRDCAAAH